MKNRLWLLERGSVPPCYCPFEPPYTVVLGLSWLGMPPGQVVGEFSLDEAGDVQIRLYRHEEDVQADAEALPFAEPMNR